MSGSGRRCAPGRGQQTAAAARGKAKAAEGPGAGRAGRRARLTLGARPHRAFCTSQSTLTVVRAQGKRHTLYNTCAPIDGLWRYRLSFKVTG
ncbi:hypothetical protein EVAR_98077_1 [Eumeta japonica]|uniref:Uncharacterized protein n=1 Tax=Eumeta variegata TaxID=151549 RepID=A0A4C1WCW4_EUMVA|nr:hypothetical protein EVAR_98077_1 [Eumeta japonica]